MLVKFSVKNYKQFKDKITFDLSAGNYSFNEECVKDGVVKTALIYGGNSKGKTSLGLAIFDLVEHLTNNSSSSSMMDNYIINALSKNEHLEFSFEFNLLNSKVVYKYSKNETRKIYSEHLNIDEKTVIDYKLGKPFTTTLEGTEHLNKELNKLQNLSVLNYILNNSNLDTNNHDIKVFIEMMGFIKNMVWFQSMSMGMGMAHIGNALENNIATRIVNNGLDNFEEFLNANGVECKLKTIYLYGETSIGFDFDGNIIPFLEIASTGTKHLLLFYFWWIETQERNVSLLFIDEFDSSYHFKLSKNIVKKLKELPNTQVILTTHNTNLLNNDLIRPDCGFIIDGKEIKALQHCTERELRHAHNLEKMYKAGAFDV